MPRTQKSSIAKTKVIGLEAAIRKVRAAGRRGESIVFTNGCFDLLHVGHIRSLEQASRLGDRLIVAVNTDAGVRRLKGKDRPLVPARHRAELLASLSCIDWVILFSETTPLRVIRKLKPDVLAKGGDWQLNQIVGRDDVESWGGRVVRLKKIPGVRTQKIIEKIQALRE